MAFAALGMYLYSLSKKKQASNERVAEENDDSPYDEPREEDLKFVGDTIDDIWALPWPEDPGSAEYKEFFRRLPPEARVIWATWLVQLHLQDWGFGEYFMQIKHGVLVSEAERGFDEIGAKDLGAMLTQVADYYMENREAIESSESIDEYNKWMGIDVIERKFGDILDTFYANKSCFYRLRAEYIRANEQVFQTLK